MPARSACSVMTLLPECPSCPDGQKLAVSHEDRRSGWACGRCGGEWVDMTRAADCVLQSGDQVRIAYITGPVVAEVIDVSEPVLRGREPQWVEVRQISDFEDRPAAQRPTYEALIERCTLLLRPTAR